MNIIGIGGIFLGAIFIVVGIMLEGDLGAFYDLPSIFIVLGGVIASTIASYNFKQFIGLGRMLIIAFSKDKFDYKQSISNLITLANIARREGVLALEEEANALEDPFLKKGIILVVDGSDPELVKNIMETELNFIEERHGQGQAVLYSMSSYSPAYGMIGTLIGLINMLQHLEDSDTLGASMAIALVTTFYGVVLANLVFTPIAGRLKEKTEHEVKHKEMLIEGILSIQAGENPRIIEEKLKSFLSYKEQSSYEYSSKERINNG